MYERCGVKPIQPVQLQNKESGVSLSIGCYRLGSMEKLPLMALHSPISVKHSTVTLHSLPFDG